MSNAGVLMKTELLCRLTILALLSVLFLTNEAAYGQNGQSGESERGQIEVGVRQLYGERDSAKFKEYRDIPQGFFIRYSSVNLDDLFNNTFFFNFQSRDIRERDQT